MYVICLLQIVFAPILWAQASLRKAFSDGLFPSDLLYKACHEWKAYLFKFLVESIILRPCLQRPEAMCDDTQNLNKTETETFSDTNSDTFLKQNFILNLIFFWYRIRYHLKNGKVLKSRSFETETSPKMPQIWTKPNRNIFPYRNRYFFLYQIFLIPNPILFSIPNFICTESETIKKIEKFQNREVLKPRSFETEKFWNREVSKPRSFETEKFRNREVSKLKCHTLPWGTSTFNITAWSAMHGSTSHWFTLRL